VYAENFALVWRGLARLGTPAESLEDAVQDVFLVVHRKYAEFRGRSAFTTWLYGIAVRVAKDHRRAETRHRRRVREFQHAAEHLVQQTESPVELVQAREAAQIVQNLLEQLPEAQRELLVLVELEQLPIGQASKILGIGLRTAQRRLQRARSEFDALLAAEHTAQAVNTSPQSRVTP
jgi:RNA polymerase sigma-70 factor, ECF subfamily